LLCASCTICKYEGSLRTEGAALIFILDMTIPPLTLSADVPS
jgi:hypothetical protein